MPRGKEDEARSFYVDVLGLTEQPKPAELIHRGGVWLRSGDVSVHLGVDDNFRAATKGRETSFYLRDSPTATSPTRSGTASN
jgi:hypothetical protein